jgi:hypothetical protein
MNIMANLTGTLDARFGLQYVPSSFLIRIGRRQACICRDFRKRYYEANPVFECRTGADRGHLEVLFLRRWLIIFSKNC